MLNHKDYYFLYCENTTKVKCIKKQTLCKFLYSRVFSISVINKYQKNFRKCPFQSIIMYHF